MKILITGVTGTLGSVLLRKLEAGGHFLYCLVRGSDKLSPAARLKALDSRATAISSDITEPMCGLSAESITMLKDAGIDVAFHCAASINFSLSKKAETSSVNTGGTANVLELAVGIDAKSFHHISTAYVAGDSKYFSECDLQKNQVFRNPYEKSKFDAEELVHLSCLRHGMPYSIYRPSVIVGDFSSGEIESFDGYYGFFKYLAAMRNRAREKAQLGVGNGFAKMVRRDVVYFPITVRCSFSSTINLVARDWVANNTCRLVTKEAKNKTFNLVAENPPKVKWVIEETLKLMGIHTHLLEDEDPSRLPLQKGESGRLAEVLQRGFDSTEDLYWPYITSEPVFSLANLKDELGRNYVPCPEVDAKFLKVLIAHAEKKRWGIREREEILV